MAERVGLPPCNGSAILNNLSSVFQVLRRWGSGEATGGDVSLAVVVTSLHVGGLWTCDRSSSDPGQQRRAAASRGDWAASLG